jgi:aminomethyltransferase
VLRLEAGNVLYGHEIDEETTPLEAGLQWVVKAEKGAFLGSDALAAERVRRFIAQTDPNASSGPSRRLVGLVSETRAIPRQGYPIVRDGDTLGVVTSGTFSPTLDRPIAMAYVIPSAAREGETVPIIVRGRPEPARVVPLPFYRGQR